MILIDINKEIAGAIIGGLTVWIGTEKVRPRLNDWYAGRSKAAAAKRIKALEYETVRVRRMAQDTGVFVAQSAIYLFNVLWLISAGLLCAFYPLPLNWPFASILQSVFRIATGACFLAACLSSRPGLIDAMNVRYPSQFLDQTEKRIAKLRIKAGVEVSALEGPELP